MNINDLFTKEVIKNIKMDINKGSDQEIYLMGKLNPQNKKVMAYNLLARGNFKMTSAISTDLKPGNLIIHNHLSGDLTPSAVDIRIASWAENNGIGFIIINNELEEAYVVIEPELSEDETLLDSDEIVSLFRPGGRLNKYLFNYEYREEQIKVAKEVINSFNLHQQVFIEAGTGTGKSLAYLIPALYWAKLNKQVVVISTNTINLQEQLIDKDLVLLKKALPFSFKTILVKGRGNYICKRKIRNMEKIAKELFVNNPSKEMEFIKIMNWLEDTKTGSKSELNFMIKTDLWDEIASESDLCLRTNCPYFDSCYFMLARKEVFDADLLIVNHHLLISDALLKNESKGRESGILPKYKNLIIDEAHNFGDVATKHLGHPFYYQTLNKYLQSLYHNKYSLVPLLRNSLSGLDLKNKQEILNIFDKKIIPQIQRVRDKSGDYFQLLKKFVDKEKEDVIRLTAARLYSQEWDEIKKQGDNLVDHLNNLGIYLNDLNEELLKLKSAILKKFENKMIELESAIFKCQQLSSNLTINLEVEDEEYVFWLKKGHDLTISQENALLDITKILSELLWDQVDTVILTSATLTINHDFKFFMESFGLERSRHLQIESPFNYEEQASLIIPIDIPPANSADFLNKIIEDLKEILISFGGATMVLFTSYRMLNYCVHKIELALNRNEINILPQGRFSRGYIIENFKKNDHQIIFGTVSFWEGVDIKGDNLKYLIIMKLPFPVPSEPVAAARMERMQKEGKNPFFCYSLPRAVIRFKQGFGRLIRSCQDKGIVITLDNRLLIKSYGRVFLNSLPTGCPVKKVNIKSLKSINL